MIIIAGIILLLAMVALVYFWRKRNSSGGDKGTASPPIVPPLPTRSELKKQFHVIKDNYNSLSEVQKALRNNGLESSNLIIGIDFTKSNNWTGERTFGGKCLHFLAHGDVCARVRSFVLMPLIKLFMYGYNVEETEFSVFI